MLNSMGTKFGSQCVEITMRHVNCFIDQKNDVANLVTDTPSQEWFTIE